MTEFRQLLDDLETAGWRVMVAASRDRDHKYLSPELRKVFSSIEELIDGYETEAVGQEPINPVRALWRR